MRTSSLSKRKSHGTRFEVSTEKGVVVVDGARHMFVVDTPERGQWEIGVSRAGLRAVLKIARDDLALWPTKKDSAVLEAGVVGCVAVAAGERVKGHVFDDVAAVGRTPIMYSRPFLDARYLVADAERFRPCRIAIALIEDAANNDSTPEHVDGLIERLVDWRALFSPDGTTGKKAHAINATLADFGDVASPAALWSLRNVALSRRAQSAAHVEVLGELGAHRRLPKLGAHIRIVEDALEVELEAALQSAKQVAVGVPANATAAHALAELLAVADGNVEGLRFKELCAFALKKLRMQLPAATPTARPPVPIPLDAGVRLLSCFGDVIDEGKRMHHCVGASRFAAAAGEAFVFRIDHQGEKATVQLDADGRVVEAKGPNNKVNGASEWGALLLARWGRDFWFAKLGWRARTWPAGFADPPANTGFQPLMTVEACFKTFHQLLADKETPVFADQGAALTGWLKEYARRAVAGDVGLAAGVDSIVAFDATGRVVSSPTSSLLPPELRPPIGDGIEW